MAYKVDLTYTSKVAGADPNDLPEPLGRDMRHDHLPEGVQPWKNVRSAGQGIDLIHDIPVVVELVAR